MNKPNQEDVIKWPDGVWCYRYELPEMTHKSDDYEVLYFQSTPWFNFMYLMEG